MRIKLFLLMQAFSLVALVRPRKVMELLEAADAGARAQSEKDLVEQQNALIMGRVQAGQAAAKAHRVQVDAAIVRGTKITDKRVPL